MPPENHAEEIEKMLVCIEAWPDPKARDLMLECLQAVLQIHGEGLDRILHIVEVDGKLPDALLQDGLVRSLLLVHGLHPLSLETRLQQALDKVLPYIHSHGGNVELISLTDGVAHLRLQGACKTCPSSAVTLELAVKGAVEEFCPDLLGLEVEGQAAPTGPALECVKA